MERIGELIIINRYEDGYVLVSTLEGETTLMSKDEYEEYARSIEI